MVSPFEGKTENFQKNTKTSPKTGSGRTTFREFPGYRKIQDEMPGAGKRGGAGGYAPRENHPNLLRTRQTHTSSWKYRVAEKEAPSAQTPGVTPVQ